MAEIRVKFKGRSYASPKRGFEAIGIALRKSAEKSAEDVKADLRKYVDRVIEAIISRNSAPWPGGTTDDSLSKRSGGLISQLQDSGTVNGSSFSNLTASFRLTGSMYIHEYGGVIKGQNKMLTIPLPAALDNRGVPKKQSARDWANTFVAETKRGNLIIFQRQGGRRIVPLYLLRDSVYIPPRLGFRQTVKSQLPYFMEKAADDIVRKIASR